jgi:hypothetical protein
MPGEPDQIYVDARRALLDALDALGPQAAAIVLVGAQAIYLHASDADVAVAMRTRDSDLAVDPRELADQPTLEAAMLGAGFRLSDDPGIWLAEGTGAQVDLLVPESLAFGKGRRGARVPGHGANSARRAGDLEHDPLVGLVPGGPVLPHQGRRDEVPSLDRLGQRAHERRRASSGGAMTTSSVVARVRPT